MNDKTRPQTNARRRRSGKRPFARVQEGLTGRREDDHRQKGHGTKGLASNARLRTKTVMKKTEGHKDTQEPFSA